MRSAFPLLLLIPTISFAQTKEMIDAVERKLERQRTAKWVLEQEAPQGGFYLAPQDPKSDAAPERRSVPPTARYGRSSISASRYSRARRRSTRSSC